MAAGCREPGLAVPGNFWEGERPLAQEQPRLWERGSNMSISGGRSSMCLGYKRETGTMGRDLTALAH